MSVLSPLRTLAIAFACCLLTSAAVAAPSVVVGWDPNPAPENVSGYVLYWSSVSRDAPDFTGFNDSKDVGTATEWTIDLPDGTARCYFSVTAYNADGLVSDYSTELGTVVVTPTATAGGVVSPAEPVVVEAGGSLDLHFTPDSGYEVEDIEIDGVSVGAATTYTLRSIDAPCAVLTRFAPAQPEPTQYNVTLSAGDNGTVLPNGTITVTEGSNLTFTVTPDSGYQVAAVRVNGTDLGAVSTHTFSAVSADMTVTATFESTDPTDSDGDQLPDAWELQYFSGLDTDPASDADGDGRTNYQEYVAGTDPTIAQLDPSFTPAVASPISGATVVSSTLDLAVDNPINDAGVDLSYQFEVSTQIDMSVPVASASGLIEDPTGVTAWPLPVSLDDQTRYYWRARTVGESVASDWTPVSTFYLDTVGAPTTTELVMAEFVSANADISVEILDPTSAVDGLGIDVQAATLPYDFILTVSTVSNPPPVLRATRLAGQTVEFGPHGRPFSQDVTILLPYTDQTLAEAGIGSAADLDVLTYNTTTLRWETVPDVVTDYAGRRMIARVSHFSMYSLGVASEQTPVAIPASSGGGGGCFIRSLW